MYMQAIWNDKNKKQQRQQQQNNNYNNNNNQQQQQQYGSIPKMEAKFLTSALSFLSIFLAIYAQSFGKLTTTKIHTQILINHNNTNNIDKGKIETNHNYPLYLSYIILLLYMYLSMYVSICLYLCTRNIFFIWVNVCVYIPEAEIANNNKKEKKW